MTGFKFQMLSNSSLHTIICKYKLHVGMKETSSVTRDECVSVRKVNFNSRTSAKDLVKMLAEAGKKASLTTMKQVLVLVNGH